MSDTPQTRLRMAGPAIHPAVQDKLNQLSDMDKRTMHVLLRHCEHASVARVEHVMSRLPDRMRDILKQHLEERAKSETRKQYEPGAPLRADHAPSLPESPASSVFREHKEKTMRLPSNLSQRVAAVAEAEKRGYQPGVLSDNKGRKVNTAVKTRGKSPFFTMYGKNALRRNLKPSPYSSY